MSQPSRNLAAPRICGATARDGSRDEDQPATKKSHCLIGFYRNYNGFTMVYDGFIGIIMGLAWDNDWIILGY